MGGVNTGLTYLLYVALALFFPYLVSYSASYVVGIFLSYYLNSRFVFKQKMTLGKALKYPGVYVLQYLMSTALLYVSVELLQINQFLAPAFALVITIPVVFLLSRFIING